MYTIPKTAHWVLVTVLMVAGEILESFITWFVRRKLHKVLEEHRIESLIYLLRGEINTIVLWCAACDKVRCKVR